MLIYIYIQEKKASQNWKPLTLRGTLYHNLGVLCKNW